MSETFAYAAQILIGASLFAVFYGVLYPESLREDWDSDETSARVTRFVRRGRVLAIMLLALGAGCLIPSWQLFASSSRVFLLSLCSISAYCIGYHFWITRKHSDGSPHNKA